MIEEHYGFRGPPFRLMPDPRFFYASRSHRAALEYLRYGLHQGEGFVVITGDVGTGKTTLLQRMLEELDGGAFVAAAIVTTAVEPDDAIRLFLSAFGVPAPEPGKAAQIEALRRFLLGQREAGRHLVLLVDEAQNLPLRTLEEMRMLSNLTMAGEPLVQIFLLGQPQFRTTLTDPNLEQFRQRVTASYHLRSLSAAETRKYIEHRLTAVGWTGTPSFSEVCFARIHEETGGVPRRINTLCTRLLLFGCLEEIAAFDAPHVDAVVRDFRNEELGGVPPARPPTARTATAWPPPGLPDMPETAALEARIAGLEALVRRQEALLRAVLGTAVGVLAAEMRTSPDDGASVGATGARG
ncbi:MAG TPA: XrtA/PEP-CTERM system-associated ATPase [Azospirillum sp.]|nr:XrtA/PEP-CTERM system-associated ATPase [Azospirillum sp.]